MEESAGQTRKIELNDGTYMPLLGLGTFKPESTCPDMSQRAVEAAIAAGYRHIDTAYSYRVEAAVRKAIQSMIQQGIIRRQDMFIVSKVLLRYHVQQDIVVIPKSMKPHHILENTKIFDFTLDEEDMNALRSLNRGWKACIITQ